MFRQKPKFLNFFMNPSLKKTQNWISARKKNYLIFGEWGSFSSSCDFPLLQILCSLAATFDYILLMVTGSQQEMYACIRYSPGPCCNVSLHCSYALLVHVVICGPDKYFISKLLIKWLSRIWTLPPAVFMWS